MEQRALVQIAGIAFSRPMPVPMLARPVRAGFPSPADDFIEKAIDLQNLLVGNRAATFLVRVAGDSVIQKGLHDGDLAVVDRSLTPRDGDVVVVDVDGERSFKVWRRIGGRVMLSFANPRLPAFELDEAALVEVWGVVAHSIHTQRRAGVSPRAQG